MALSDLSSLKLFILPETVSSRVKSGAGKPKGMSMVVNAGMGLVELVKLVEVVKLVELVNWNIGCEPLFFFF